MLRDPARWRDVDLAHMAFGYGLTATPIQIAAAMAAIGDHGHYHPPRIVDEIDDADGTVLYRADAEARQAISEKTADQMRTMLVSVFDKGKDGGTAKNVDVAGFRCAGKTGTAHKYDPETHHYSPDRYLASFAGLAPADQPRLAIVVMIDEPSGADHYGGDVSGPVFAAVASQALRYLGVPGQALPPPPPVAGARPTVAPPASPAITQPAIETADEPARAGTPDFHGLGMTRALDLAREHHLAVALDGTGQVISQDPPPGAPGERVTLHFSDEHPRVR
jgi:cell division protein FtsI (penicillin-binding protein 3)